MKLMAELIPKVFSMYLKISGNENIVTIRANIPIKKISITGEILLLVWRM